MNTDFFHRLIEQNLCSNHKPTHEKINNNNINIGNSIRGSVEAYNHKGYFETKAHDETIFKESAMTAHKLDNFLQPIVKSCPMILMPGEFDPTCHSLPQQSIHPCILPQCFR